MPPASYVGMNFPDGTRVQIPECPGEDEPVALAPQFLFPDHSAGASGKPDSNAVMYCGAQLIPLLPSTGLA